MKSIVTNNSKLLLHTHFNQNTTHPSCIYLGICIYIFIHLIIYRFIYNMCKTRAYFVQQTCFFYVVWVVFRLAICVCVTGCFLLVLLMLCGRGGGRVLAGDVHGECRCVCVLCATSPPSSSLSMFWMLPSSKARIHLQNIYQLCVCVFLDCLFVVAVAYEMIIYERPWTMSYSNKLHV